MVNEGPRLLPEARSSLGAGQSRDALSGPSDVYALIFEAKNAIMAKPHFERRSDVSRENVLTDTEDPLMWLTNQARKAFAAQVAKAKFRTLHRDYMEKEWNGVMTHVICALHGMSPTQADVVRCVTSKWTQAKINGDLRAMKKAAEPQRGRASTSDVCIDLFRPPIVQSSRGTYGGTRI